MFGFCSLIFSNAFKFLRIPSLWLRGFCEEHRSCLISNCCPTPDYLSELKRFSFYFTVTSRLALIKYSDPQPSLLRVDQLAGPHRLSIHFIAWFTFYLAAEWYNRLYFLKPVPPEVINFTTFGLEHYFRFLVLWFDIRHFSHFLLLFEDNQDSWSCPSLMLSVDFIELLLHSLLL